MSTGRYSQRGFAFQGFAFRTWGLSGGGTSAVTDPSQSGWIARTAGRLSVPREAGRVAIVSPQQRVWIVRSDNE